MSMRPLLPLGPGLRPVVGSLVAWLAASMGPGVEMGLPLGAQAAAGSQPRCRPAPPLRLPCPPPVFLGAQLPGVPCPPASILLALMPPLYPGTGRGGRGSFGPWRHHLIRLINVDAAVAGVNIRLALIVGLIGLGITPAVPRIIGVGLG